MPPPPSLVIFVYFLLSEIWSEREDGERVKEKTLRKILKEQILRKLPKGNP